MSSMEPLSPRLQRVADLLFEGLSYKEIAAELNLAVSTVKQYAALIYPAYGVQSQCAFYRQHLRRSQTHWLRQRGFEVLEWSRRWDSYLPRAAVAELLAIFHESIVLES